MKKCSLGKIIYSLLILVLVGCAGGGPKTSSTTLRVEWTLWSGDYTLLVASKMGYFKNHGVDVIPVRYDNVSAAIPDMASLRLDGALLTMNDLILGTNLTDIRGVYVSDNGGVLSLVSSLDINNLQGLRGKRIGVNLHTAGELFVSNMLRSVRMTSKDVTYVEMSPTEVPLSIPDVADAGLLWEPYTSQAIKNGIRVLYQSPQNSSLEPRLLAFRAALIEQRPEVIRNFLLAWQEGVDYRNAHPEEFIAIISEMTGLTPEEITLSNDVAIYTMRDNLNLFSENPGKNPTSIYYVAGINRNFLVTNGYLTIPPDIEVLLDPSFLE